MRSRARLAWCLVGTLVLAAAGAAQTPAPTAGPPKLVLSQPNWNFGSAVHLEKKELTLGLRNEGGSELQLHDIASSCGCTVAEPARRVLQPGESTTVSVVYNTATKKGHVESHLTFKSNDPANPEIVFPLEGFVKRVLEVTPDVAVMFQALDANTSETRTVKILNPGEQPIQPRLEPFATDKFTAELREIQPGKEYEVIVSTRPPFPERSARDTLALTTGLADEPRIELSTQFMVIDRVNFLPPAILVSGGPGQTSSRSVQLRYYGTDPRFNVVGVRCDEPSVKVNISPPVPGSQVKSAGRPPTSVWQMNVTFTPATRFPPTGLPIKVQTTDPEYPELTIFATPDMELYRDISLRARAESQRKAP